MHPLRAGNEGNDEGIFKPGRSARTMLALTQSDNSRAISCDGREPVWPSGKAGQRKDLGSIPLRLSFLLKKVVVCGHCLVTLFVPHN